MNVRKWKSMADRCGKESRYEGAPLQEKQLTHRYPFISVLLASQQYSVLPAERTHDHGEAVGDGNGHLVQAAGPNWVTGDK